MNDHRQEAVAELSKSALEQAAGFRGLAERMADGTASPAEVRVLLDQAIDASGEIQKVCVTQSNPHDRRRDTP